MTDSRFKPLSVLIDAPFDRYPFQRVRAIMREHTERTRQWNQSRHGLIYDLGPGAWHTQIFRSWWQAPHFWRHECSPARDPSFITSGILIQGSQWWSYRSLPPKEDLSLPEIVITSQGQVGSSFVPFLTGMGGYSARANAALWPWVDFSSAHPSWEWRLEDDNRANNKRIWQGISVPSHDDAAVWPPHPNRLFRFADTFKCQIESSSGFPLSFTGESQQESIWELTVEERSLNPEDIAQDTFFPPWLHTKGP